MSAHGECLVMRADASSSVGTGHVMRCLALAQAWQAKDGRTVFAAAEMPPAVEARIRAAGAGLVTLEAGAGSLAEAAETAALARNEGARWIVVDGYHLGSGYQHALRASGAQVLCIDDTAHHGRYEMNVVLNQNVHATAELYSDRAPGTRLLLGPRYGLLRPEFARGQPVAGPAPDVAHKFLITLGGADPVNGTRLVVDALQTFAEEDFEALVVVGGSNPRGPELEKAASWSQGRIRFIYDASNMSELMAWSDLAISAAGSTTLELAFFGLPMLLVTLADNQAPVAERMETLGAGVNLGRVERLSAESLAASIRSLMFDQPRRALLSKAAGILVDGRGALRVARILGTLTLRPVVPGDVHLLFAWTNDPAVRAASFNSAPIPWADHERWFREKLADPAAMILIAENHVQEPLGVARAQVENGVAVISIAVVPGARGDGLGHRIIEEASREILKREDVRVIHAYTRLDNIASVRAFLAAGYQEETASETARLFILQQAHV